MLRLKSDTPATWVDDTVLPNLATVLIDHAHCEKKAASTAIALLFRYPDRTALLQPLSALAREELEHFELLLALLKARGIPFERQQPSPYAGRLHEQVRREEPARLLDTLLACALIEARSCERMKLLSQTLPDPELAAFYGDLLASEARHFMTYVQLAMNYFERAVVEARLEELATHEAAVLMGAPQRPRLHAATGPAPG